MDKKNDVGLFFSYEEKKKQIRKREKRISILYQQSERRCGAIQLCNERILECKKHVLVIGCGCDG